MQWAILVVTVIIGLATLRIGARVQWYTGAMESHSDIMVKIEARRESIPMVWWDKTLGEGAPKHNHGDVVELKEIRCGLPPAQRAKRSCCLVRWFFTGEPG